MPVLRRVPRARMAWLLQKRRAETLTAATASRLCLRTLRPNLAIFRALRAVSPF